MPLLALQLLGPRDPMEAWLPLVREAVRGAGTVPVSRLSGVLADVCGLLSGGLSELNWGFWEYVDDPDQAAEDFHAWCEGTLVDIGEEAASFDPEATQMAFVTVLVLAEPGGDAHATIWAESDRIPEGEEATKQAYAHWLKVLPRVDLASARAVAVLVRPGETGEGVMAWMLEEEHYGHLVPLLF